MTLALLILSSGLPASVHSQDIFAIDDTGSRISLTKPATRVISLAPHLTELMFSIGAGALIVGTVQSADFPAAEMDIPRVGNNASIDMEQVVALQPGLVLVWQSSIGSNHASGDWTSSVAMATRRVPAGCLAHELSPGPAAPHVGAARFSDPRSTAGRSRCGHPLAPVFRARAAC